MILYVNGDSHSTGHGIVNSAGMTEDDFQYQHIAEAPYPDNFVHSWGYKLAELLNIPLVCQARSGGSLDRCIRTTRNFLYQTNKKVFVIIGIPSFERIEVKHNEQWFQFNIGDHTRYPDALHQKFKEWLSSVGNYHQYHRPLLEKLYAFNNELNGLNIPHYFFNTEQTINQNIYNFNKSYDSKFSFRNWCIENGFKSDEWNHFKQDAQLSFAKNFLLEKIKL